jgi:hypothetical protein
VNNSKAEIFLERVEIMVSVKQGMALRQTESCDEAVDGLPNRMAAGSKETIVLCGGDGQRLTSTGKHLELEQVAPDAREGGFSTDSLENLAQNEIGQPQALLVQLSVEPISVWIHGSCEVADPDSGIHNGHGQNLILNAT